MEQTTSILRADQAAPDRARPGLALIRARRMELGRSGAAMTIAALALACLAIGQMIVYTVVQALG